MTRKLDTWIKKRGMKKVDLARMLQLHDDYFYNRSRKTKMSSTICRKLMIMSEGELTLQDLRPDFFPVIKKKPPKLPPEEIQT